MVTTQVINPRSFDYIKVYLTYRWISNKFDCSTLEADELATQVTKKLKKAGNTSSQYTLEVLCRIYNAHLRKNGEPALDGNRYDAVYDAFNDIVALTFNYAAKRPYVIDDLLKKNPRILNANMKRLWELYKKRTLPEEVILKKMNKPKLAVNAIRNGMFVRLVEAYEKLPEFGPYNNK